MISRFGAYGAKSQADQLADAQRAYQREIGQRNPSADRLVKLREDIARLSASAGDEDVMALSSFAQRTGLDVALAANQTPPPVTRTEVVDAPVTWWPVALGALVLAAAVVLT